MANKKASNNKESFISKYGVFVAIIAILAIFLVIMLVTGGKDKKVVNKGELSSIAVTDWVEKTKSDETMVTVFAQTTCGWCNKFKPVVKKVLKENDGVKIYWIDVDTISEDDYNSLGEAYKELSKFGTPYTIITKEGKKVDEISGYVEKDELISKLKENGILK